MRSPSLTKEIQRAIDAFRRLLRWSLIRAIKSGVSPNFGAISGFWSRSTLNIKWLAAAVALSIILTLAGFSLFTPRYRSEVHISIGGNENLVTHQNDSRGLHDDSDVGTLLQLLLSRDLARDVIRKNRLDELPEFDPILGELSMLRSVAGTWIGIGTDPLEATPIERILAAYYDRLRVHFAPNSDEIILDFQSRDPQLAARVADSIAESYVALGHRQRWLDGKITLRAVAAPTPSSPSKPIIALGAMAAAFALAALAVGLSELFQTIARRRSTTVRAVTVWTLLPTTLVFAAATIVPNAVVPRYSSDVYVLVDLSKDQFVSPQGLDGSTHRENMARQVQSLLSEDVAIRMIEKYKLDQSPEFDPVLAPASVFQFQSLEDLTPRQRALQSWYERLSVYSVPNSRVLVIAFQSSDPELAAKVSSAIAEDFLLKRRGARQAAITNDTGEPPLEERIISHAIETNSPAHPRKQLVTLIATILTLTLMIFVVATTNLSLSRMPAFRGKRSPRPRVVELLRTLRHHVGANFGDPALLLNWVVRYGLAAIVSLVPTFLLANNWQIFFPIWFAVSVTMGLLPLERVVSRIRNGRQAQSSPPKQPTEGELLAKLRAEWLRPTRSEKEVAVLLLLLPSVFHWASFVLGTVPDGAGTIATAAKWSPWIGMAVVGGYRRRRRRKQAELNERAIELTQRQSEFILYLRSFNTSNRLRVRNTTPKTLDRLLVGVHWDIEYAFSHAFESTAPLVAIGSKGKGIGAAKIQTEDSRWKELFTELAGKARAILVVPSRTPGTRHEIWTVAQADHLLGKTIWVMPPTYLGIRPLIQRLLVGSHKRNWEAVRSELRDSIELPRYRRSGALVYAGFSGKGCKQYEADDLAEDRLRPLVDTVIAASTMEDQARSATIDAFALPGRPTRFRVEEWLFRRWIAGLGSSINSDLLIVSVVVLPILFSSVVALSGLTGFVPIGPVVGKNMLPTLLPGDTIVIRQGSNPTRGDIVAVIIGDDNSKTTSGVVVSRLMGLPGDRVKIEHGAIYINEARVVQQPVEDKLAGVGGECLAESNSLPEGVQFKTLTCRTSRREEAAKVKAAQNVAEFIVPPDKLFVADDLRGGQFIDLVSRADIGGKAAFVAFSVRRTHVNIFARIRWDRFLKKI